MERECSELQAQLARANQHLAATRAQQETAGRLGRGEYCCPLCLILSWQLCIGTSMHARAKAAPRPPCSILLCHTLHLG
jgi:hypothetical protein